MCFHFLHVGYRCGPSIIIGRTWDDVRTKVRTRRKVWSARRARWQSWKKFGVDWDFVEQQSRIVDIKHSRRFPSKEKFKIVDADKRVMKKLKVKKLSVSKQPGICITPSLYTSNVEAKMFNEEDSGASQVKCGASSKRNTSGFPSSYFLRTSTDVVTYFFYPFNGRRKVASRKKSVLSEEDILGIKVSDFFYYSRRFRKRKQKKIRSGEKGLKYSQNIFPDGRNAKVRSVRLRKARKKKKPGVKSVRVLPAQDPGHLGPRYNISFREAFKAYGRMRKGRGFYPSNKVIWKNRHALVLGCSNFYKGKDDENLKVDNKEYDIVEPPEPSSDPEVPTTGSEFSSDETGDGPVKRNIHLERKRRKNYQKGKDGSLPVDRVEKLKKFQRSRSSHGRGGNTQKEQTNVSEMDFSKIMQNTAHRRKSVQLVGSKSPQVQHTDERIKRRYSGALRNEMVDSSVQTTDSVLWEYMCKVGKNLAETDVLKIISDYDHRDRTLELEKSIDHLEELVNEGNASAMILKIWKKNP